HLKSSAILNPFRTICAGWLTSLHLGAEGPEDNGCGLLNGLQTLAEEVGVSVPKLDVILGCGSVLQPDRLADHKGHGFGLGLTNLLRGQWSTFAAMEHLVCDLMYKRRKLLGWLHS